MSVVSKKVPSEGDEITEWGEQHLCPLVLRQFLFIPSLLSMFYNGKCMFDFIKYVSDTYQYYHFFSCFGPINRMILMDFLMLSHPCIPGNKLYLVMVYCYFNSIHSWIWFANSFIYNVCIFLPSCYHDWALVSGLYYAENVLRFCPSSVLETFHVVQAWSWPLKEVAHKTVWALCFF